MKWTLIFLEMSMLEKVPFIDPAMKENIHQLRCVHFWASETIATLVWLCVCTVASDCGLKFDSGVKHKALFK